MLERVAPLLAASFLATSVFAQTGERITVRLIEVPVTVIDRDGNPVRGLTAANFALSDDGKKQPITSFDSIDFASKESVTAISPLNPSARRSFFLLFDLGYSGPKSLARAKEAARTFVEKNVQPRDVVGVGTFDTNRGFRMIVSFTPDRQLVAAAIVQPELFKSSDPLQIAGTVEKIYDDTMPRDLPGGYGHASDGAPGNRAENAAKNWALYAREINRKSMKQNEEYVRGMVQKQIATLGNLASMLRVVPGRKHVVLLSEGIDAKYVIGRDVHHDFSQENDSVLHGQSWKIDSDARYGSTANIKVVDEMAHLFRGADVVLDAIDIQGLRTTNDLREAGERTDNDVPTALRNVNSSEGLSVLALPTGGTVFRNANDLAVDFAKLIRREEVVYVLGFHASPSGKPAKFHDLKVKLLDVPAGSQASFRSGYYETGGETAAERVLTNAEIVVSDIPQSGIETHAVSGAFIGSGRNAQVPVVVEMNGRDLLKDPHGNPSVELYVYAFDAGGFVRDRLYQQMTLDIAKIGEKLKNRGVKYFGTMSLPPGTYAIKSLVKLANSDVRGFARTDVVVPKEGELSVAPFFIDDAPGEWVLVRGTSHEQSAPYPFAIEGRNLVPSAGGRDAAGQPRTMAVVVRNAKADDVAIETDPKSTVVSMTAEGGMTHFVVRFDAAISQKKVQLSVTTQGSGATRAVVSLQ